MQQVSGWSEQGGSVVTVPGTQGSGSQRFQQSFRGATITVRDSSNNLATIYSDDLATPTAKANPFTASSTTGSWSFFTTTGTYTVTFSGASITAPFSITVNLGLGNAGGVPSYAFASLPASKTQNAGDIARLTDRVRGLWIDTGVQWADILSYIDVRFFGAVGDGATNDTVAIAAAITAARTYRKPIYFPQGTGSTNPAIYLVTTLNFASAGAVEFNNGLTVFGDGINNSIINIIPGVNNTGVGMDLTCAAYVHFKDIRINNGSGSTNCNQVGVLLAKGSYGGVVFSGIMTFENCLFTFYGSYGIYILGAEQIDFQNCNILGLHSQCVAPVVISRANTAAITSPNATVNSPADSMTAISFTGYESAITGLGTQLVLFDIGALALASISFRDTFLQCNGATTTAFRDNGLGGSTLDRITLDNVKVEVNGGAGTNVVMNLSAATLDSLFVTGTLSSTVAQTSTEFVFGNIITNSFFNWHGNDAGTGPALIIDGVGAQGCIFQVKGDVSTVDMNGTGNYIVYAQDFIRGRVNSYTFTGTPVFDSTSTFNGEPTFNSTSAFVGVSRWIPGTTDATTYQLMSLRGGVRAGATTDGGIFRRTTAAVTNATPVEIYTTSTYGELLVVTGVGSGDIFADLLMVGFATNAVTVISSSGQAGSPASRTYAMTSGSLTLVMGDATSMAIIVQAIRTGGQGA